MSHSRRQRRHAGSGGSGRGAHDAYRPAAPPAPWPWPPVMLPADRSRPGRPSAARRPWLERQGLERCGRLQFKSCVCDTKVRPRQSMANSGTGHMHAAAGPAPLHRMRSEQADGNHSYFAADDEFSDPSQRNLNTGVQNIKKRRQNRKGWVVHWYKPHVSKSACRSGARQQRHRPAVSGTNSARCRCTACLQISCLAGGQQRADVHASD